MLGGKPGGTLLWVRTVLISAFHIYPELYLPCCKHVYISSKFDFKYNRILYVGRDLQELFQPLTLSHSLSFLR